MDIPDTPGKLWRIGELAAATKVTVRTLHHYEQIGLLAAVRRSGGRHRLYDDAAVRQLYRIRALRELGLSLDDIKASLGQDESLMGMLQTQLARTEERMLQLGGLRDRLRSLTALPEKHIDADSLLATLAAMRSIEQRSHAPKAGQGLGAWERVGRELRTCMDTGLAPDAPAAQEIARRARALIREFSGGDPRVEEALARLRSVAPPTGLHGWDAALVAYLDKALACGASAPQA
ncbi:MerR family transcriptional regulator [Massilia sp. IC2-476]|uniref:MerR family transcriptional regulator n=1 Tax=Massilia sp. IC2-476 TaxID=2887199 RepID=UPI001D1269B4|nr:MerR family transcriptional regulator [Massilia sp. IC2-476]MCC2974139.1 MerR family transcriptional regulator [Massilia sp. IC2-476]